MKRSTFLKSLAGAAIAPVVISQIATTSDKETTESFYPFFSEEKGFPVVDIRLDELLKEIIHEDENGSAYIAVKE